MFGPTRPTTSCFKDINHFIIPKKGQKKNIPKIQNFKFHYCCNNFGRDPPQEYT